MVFDGVFNSVDKITKRNFNKVVSDLKDGLKGYSQETVKLAASQANLTKKQAEAIFKAKGLTGEQLNQAISTATLSTSQKAATVSTIGFSTALKKLWATMMAKPLIAIGMAVTIVSTAWNVYKQSVQEAIQASNKATDEFNSTSSAIKDYADRYKELHTELLDANTSEERQNEIKSDLLSLQKELNNSYGDEYGRLNLVTDAYRDQTKAILDMNKAAAQNHLLDNKKGIETATREMAKERTYELGSTGILNDDYSREIYNVASLYKDQGVSLTQIEGTDLPAYTITFNGNAEEAEKVIRELSNKIQDLDNEFKDHDAVGSVLSYTTKALKNNRSILDDYQADYNASLMANIAADDELSKGYSKAYEAVTKYNEAVISGDETKILDARNNLGEVKNSIDLSSEEWIRYASIISNVFNEANTGIYDFRDALADNKNGIANFLPSLQGKTKEELLAMQDDDKFDNFDKLISSADEYKLTVDQVIDELVRMGIVQGDIARSGKGLSADFANMFSNLPVGKIEEYVSLFNSGDMTEKNISSISELNDLMSQTGTSAEDAVKAIKDYADGYTLSTDLTANIQSGYNLLQNVEKQYKETGKIGLSSLESIAKQYPQLRTAVTEYTQGLISVDDIISKLHTTYEADAESYRNSMAQRLSDDTVFFEKVKSNNQSLFYDLSQAYGLDVENWKTMAKAKAEIDQQLMGNLSDAWSKYYKIVFDESTHLASVEGVAGSKPEGIGGEMSKAERNALDAASAAKDKHNDFINRLNEAANIIVKVPDIDFIGSDGSNKDKKDPSKDIDWIDRQLKLLDDKRSELLNKAGNTYIDYLGITQEQFNRAQELFNSDPESIPSGFDELGDMARSAGVTIAELYSLIANGVSGESRQSYLEQALEIDKEALAKYADAVQKYQEEYDKSVAKISPQYRAKIENGDLSIDTLSGDESEEVQKAITDYDKLNETKKAQYEKQKQYLDDIVAKYDNISSSILNENKQLENSNSMLERQIEYYQSAGVVVDSLFYNRLIQNTASQVANTKALLANKRAELQDLIAEGVSSSSEEYAKLNGEISDAEISVYTLKKAQEEYNNKLLQLPIENMSILVSMYKDIGTAISNWGNEVEASGKKLDTNYYQNLISNGMTVIDQLHEQSRIIADVQENYNVGSDQWNKLYQQLTSVNSEVSSMVGNLQKWNEELLKMPIENISGFSSELQKVADGLSKVQSEQDQVISAVTGAIQKQIDVINNQKTAYQEANESQKKGLQNKLDLLQKQNDQLKRQMAYEQSLYNLQKINQQATELVIRNGQESYEVDADKLREAQEQVTNAKFDLETGAIQDQIDSLDEALEKQNELYDSQIEKLEIISNRWSEISEKVQTAQNEAKTSSILGNNWKGQVLSGNDTALFNTFSKMYQNTAEQLKKYQDQIDSTNNIQSLLEDYVASYKAGEITYSEAVRGINTLLSQLNQNMSATGNLQNLFDYLGIVNDTSANADSVLKGIQSGLKDTATELLKSMEQYNKNAGIISEHTSSWQKLTSNVEKMLDVLREVRDALEDDYDNDDYDDEPYDKSRGKGWLTGDVNNGPGIYADGIKNGLVGSSSDNERGKMIRYLATNELKPGQVPILAHEGEAVLNREQQYKLLENFASTQRFVPNVNIPDYSSILKNINIADRTTTPVITFNGGINIQECNNSDDLASEILNGGLTMAINQGLGRR